MRTISYATLKYRAYDVLIFYSTLEINIPLIYYRDCCDSSSWPYCFVTAWLLDWFPHCFRTGSRNFRKKRCRWFWFSMFDLLMFESNLLSLQWRRVSFSYLHFPFFNLPFAWQLQVSLHLTLWCAKDLFVDFFVPISYQLSLFDLTLHCNTILLKYV